jgi:4-carboxymuconolactone decarboxylase
MRFLILLVILITGVLSAQQPPQIQLRGDRFPGIPYEQMTPEQKALTDRALAGRGAVGTFNIMLRSPELSEIVRGTAGTRTRSELSPKHTELAIILNARYWTTQFEWLVHRQAAEQAGLSKELTTAIAEGRRPPTMAPDERAIYDFVSELLRTKQVADSTFSAAKNLLGEKGIVDVIGMVGFYQLTSLLMNADRYPMQSPDQKPELKLLRNPLPGPAVAASAGPPRFPAIPDAQLSPAQKNLSDLIASGKIQGSTRGPFNALLRSPVLGEAIMRYGEYVRFRTPLAPKLNELAVLIVCRSWTSQFPWYAHRSAATQAGLNEAVIKAIAEGRRPAALQPDELAVYNFATELLRTTQVSDGTFAAAKAQLGERGLVELMGVMGYYGIVSMLVNTDRYPLPEGVAPELKPLADPLP